MVSSSMLPPSIFKINILIDQNFNSKDTLWGQFFPHPLSWIGGHYATLFHFKNAGDCGNRDSFEWSWGHAHLFHGSVWKCHSILHMWILTLSVSSSHGVTLQCNYCLINIQCIGPIFFIIKLLRKVTFVHTINVITQLLAK